MKIKLPNWKSLCNDNLLINSDFKSGIINQKDKKNYTGKGIDQYDYTIDMWAFISTSGSFEITAEGLKNTGGNVNLAQFLENKLEVGKKYALTFSEDGVLKTTILTGGNYETTSMYRLINGKERILIYLNAGKTINFVKLEIGEYFTGMPLWNEALELTKCRQYFEVRTIVLPVVNSIDSRIQFLLPKEKIPSLSFIDRECFVAKEGVSGKYDFSQLSHGNITNNGFDIGQNIFSGILWVRLTYIADSYNY